MNLYEIEREVNQIVKDFKKARMYKARGMDEMWPHVERGLNYAIEIARELEEGWGDGGSLS